MENLPSIPTTAISKGDSDVDLAATHKFNTLSDAIRYARENLRNPEVLFDEDPDPYGYAQELENEIPGMDLLNPEWKAKPDDAKWVKRVKARSRKAGVARMYLQGHPVPFIAAKCKVSQVTIYRDIAQISAEWRRSYLNDIEVLASRDLARLDEMYLKLQRGINSGDTKAIDAGIKIIQERGNILGYRHGVQVDIESYVREVASSAGYDPEKAVALAQRVSVRFKS